MQEDRTQFSEPKGLLRSIEHRAKTLFRSKEASKEQEMISQEVAVISKEVKRQEQLYSESSLKEVVSALRNIISDPTFGHEFQDPQYIGDLSSESEFVYKGKKYALRYSLTRNFPAVFLEGRLSIYSKENLSSYFTLDEEHSFEEGEIAKYTFDVLNKATVETQYTNVYVDRRAKQSLPNEEVKELVFPAVGKSLVLISDLVVRDLNTRFPVLGNSQEITVSTADVATDVDGDKRTKTGRTTKIRQEMGYVVVPNKISGRVPSLVKKFR